MDDADTTPIPVSVLVIVKNEEQWIVDLVESLVQFDDIIVVDSNSSDRTAELALGAGARVVNFSWDGGYPKKKEWSIKNAGCRYQWALLLDADERLSDALVSEIRGLDLASSPQDVTAFDIRLEYWFGGKRLEHGHTVVKRALIKRDQVEYPIVDDGAIMGSFDCEGHYQPSVKSGSVGHLAGEILHDDLDPVSSWFARHNMYSDWEAYLRANPKVKKQVDAFRSPQGKVFARVPGKPVIFFFYTYILKRGFLDGRAGFDYAIALSMYYWQIDLKYREFTRGIS